MKKMKKLLSMLLTVIMVLAMAAPSFADTPVANQKGTITITNAIKDQQYSAYKMFNLESYNTDETDKNKSIYSYRVVDAWKDLLTKEEYGYDSYFTIDTNGYLTNNVTMNATVAESFAKAALAYADAKKISADRTASAVPTTTGEGEEAKTTYSATFSNVDLGYYLIDSSAGTVCTLDTTDPTISIAEKNPAPSVEKTANVTTVTIGQLVEYTIKIEAQKGAENYIAYDIMSAGLTFNPSSLNVKMGANENAATVVANTNYELVQTGLTAGRTFEVRFTKAFCDTITASTNIYITYNATVNANAISVNEITNEAGLTYGNNNGASTTPSKVEVKTFSFGLNKTNASDETIEGATFKLYRRTAGEEAGTYVYTRIKTVPVDGEKGKYRADGELTGADDTNDAAGLITAGSVTIDGLGNGEYVLEEVTAPAGYNKLVGYTNVVVINDADNITTLNVVNNTGAQLPSTGGIGTTIFYAAGIILMAGAVFFVVRRKKA